MKKNGVKKGCINKNILILFTSLIFVISAFSVNAFTLDINPDDNSINFGDDASFDLSMNIEGGERVPINYFDFKISDKTCRFETDGNEIFGCNFNLTPIIPIINSNFNITDGNRTWNYSGISYNIGNGSGYEMGYFNYTLNVNSSSIGQGNFETSFSASTFGNSTVFQKEGDNISIIKPIIINNESINGSCILVNETFTVGSNIDGSVDEVFINFELNGNEQNISLGNNGEGIYNYTFDKSKVNQTGLLEWKFIVKDIGGNFAAGSVNQIDIKNNTLLQVSYLSDGLNGWHITTPTFILSNPDSSNVYYSWNGNIIPYGGPFKLDDAPNSGNITGGIIALRYWSDLCNESKHNQTFKFDFTNPMIIPVFPAENQTLNTKNVNIQIEFDETYQSNSGINKSSIKIYLDNNLINPVINDSGTIDAIVSYNINNLSLGMHTINTSVSDNSGRSSIKVWNFEVSDLLLNSFILNVNTPISNSDILINNRVDFNITTSKFVDKISYVNYGNSDNTEPKEKVLCRKCNEYGFSKQKLKILNEGVNNLSIIAIDQFGNKQSKNLTVIIDTKKPYIKSTFPIKGFSQGNFSAVFFDKNPSSLIFHVSNNDTGSREFPINISYCSMNKYYECYLYFNLSEYEGEQLRYYFNFKDITNKSTLSRERIIEIDTILPNITFVNYSVQKNKVEFIIQVIEDNFDKINYIDMNEDNPRERALCSKLDDNSRCDVKNTFSKGSHNLTIIVYDKAGNSQNTNAHFNINPVLGG